MVICFLKFMFQETKVIGLDEEGFALEAVHSLAGEASLRTFFHPLAETALPLLFCSADCQSMFFDLWDVLP